MAFERSYRDAAFVPRFSIIRTMRTQSIAEHSYFTALYANQLADLLEWDGPRDKLLLYAMHHDLEEVITGDIVSPVKRILESSCNGFKDVLSDWATGLLNKRCPGWYNIDEDVSLGEYRKKHIKSIVHAADLLEACLFLQDELFAGNRNVTEAFNYLQDHLYKNCLHSLPYMDDIGVKNANNKLLRIVVDNVTKAIEGAGSTPSPLVTEENYVYGK